jgi:hypothetical protein
MEMAYLRGDYYVWRDGDTLHLRGPGDSKLELPIGVFDQLVVMRAAELTPGQRAIASLAAVEDSRGNVGAEALRAELGLPAAYEEPGLPRPQLPAAVLEIQGSCAECLQVNGQVAPGTVIGEFIRWRIYQCDQGHQWTVHGPPPPPASKVRRA